MGGFESKLEQDERQQAANRVLEKLQLEEQAFVQKWPQNARDFSGKSLPGMVYVVVIFDRDSKKNIPWLAFETRDEADKCLKNYCTIVASKQPYPFVYQVRNYITRNCDVTYMMSYWISVVSRKQAREAGLFCEVHEEDAKSVEGGVPESEATATATPITASAPNI